MASSYSTDLKIELMVTGENAGTWGDKTNTNLNLVQQAIAGFESISIAGGAQTTTLVMTDGALSNARNAVIKLTGAITGNQIVTIPTGIEKTYIVQNGTTGAFTVEFKQAGGTGTTFSTTDKGIKLVYADGTNVVDILTGPLSAVTIGGNLSVDGGTIKLDGNYPVGTNNVALGDGALDDASLTGGCNVAIGTNALTANTTGVQHVAVGTNALLCNTTGNNNTAVGLNSLDANTTGNCNTALGISSLGANTTASNNTGIGHNALILNTTGCQNTAVGSLSLSSNTTGVVNTAVGMSSGALITTGSCNTILGAYDGNQCSLDIRTAACNVVLSDGRGQPYIVARNGGTQFFGASFSDDLPRVSSSTNAYTNLSTVAQPADKPNALRDRACLWVIFIENVASDACTFLISTGIDAGNAYAFTAFGAGNCSVSQSPSGTFAITNMGDGRTYTFAIDTGFGTLSFKTSSLATGTTKLSIFGIGGF